MGSFSLNNLLNYYIGTPEQSKGKEGEFTWKSTSVLILKVFAKHRALSFVNYVFSSLDFGCNFTVNIPSHIYYKNSNENQQKTGTDHEVLSSIFLGYRKGASNRLSKIIRCNKILANSCHLYGQNISVTLKYVRRKTTGHLPIAVCRRPYFWKTKCKVWAS